MLKNIFKSKDIPIDPPNKIQEYFFHSNTHYNVPCFSRFHTTFGQMLQNHSLKQCFMRFLAREQLQQLLACYLDMLDLRRQERSCGLTCEPACLSAVQRLAAIIPHQQDEAAVTECLAETEDSVRHSCNRCPRPCPHLALYLRYFSTTCFSPVLPPGRTSAAMLIEIFINRPHPTTSMLSSFVGVMSDLESRLSHQLYPRYLLSELHRQYQLELLNSGIHLLRLADFLHYDEFFIHLTEFMESKGLGRYLSFLISVTSMCDSPVSTTNDSLCTFADALQIFSEFLVADASPKFLDIPIAVCNAVANRLCCLSPVEQSLEKFETGPSCLSAIGVFGDVYKPVYFFLEEYWLPRFLTSENFLRYVSKMGSSFSVRSSAPRARFSSDTSSCGTKSHLQRVHMNMVDVEDRSSVQSEPTRYIGSVSEAPVSIEEGPDEMVNEEADDWVAGRQIDNHNASNQQREKGMASGQMTLGCIDDMGEYRSCVSGHTSMSSSFISGSGIPGSRSSELLASLPGFGRLSQRPLENQTSPDEVARRIIQDVNLMSMRNS